MLDHLDDETFIHKYIQTNFGLTSLELRWSCWWCKQVAKSTTETSRSISHIPGCWISKYLWYTADLFCPVSNHISYPVVRSSCQNLYIVFNTTLPHEMSSLHWFPKQKPSFILHKCPIYLMHLIHQWWSPSSMVSLDYPVLWSIQWVAKTNALQWN